METKFEYQVSPELAEEIAREQFDILVRLPGFKLRYLPWATGFLLALLVSCLTGILAIAPVHFSTWRVGRSDYSFTENFIFMPLGFVFGFGFGFLINYFVRWKISALARSAYAKMGPARIVLWNPEIITLRSPVHEMKVHWQMIDKIKIGFLGVYGLSGRRVVFAIPKDAFPANATIADLTQAWQSPTQQPPITK